MAEKKQISKRATKEKRTQKKRSYPKEWETADVGKGYANTPSHIANLYK